ncbi:MAG: ACT domain-containing protein [Bacilli bacterium]
MDDPYYLIRRSHLPDVIRRTTLVTELRNRDAHLSVLQAVTQIGISRSAYYKYKDVAKPFQATMQGQIVTLALTLQHQRGILSEVLNLLAALHANILTINQTLPLQGVATVIISLETRDMTRELQEALDAVRDMPGVEQTLIVGQGY